MNETSRKRRITALDVAKYANVSRSAVSRAFTEGAYLDADKRKAILRAAEELGYAPNALAAGLQGAHSNLVAVFAGQMPNDYDKEALSHLIAALNAAGRWPVVIAGSDQSTRAATAHVLRYPLEAMILRSGSLDEDLLHSCSKLGVPIISSGRILDAEGVDNVCCKNQQGMETGTQLLIGRGRKHLAFIGGPAGFAASNDRKAGFLTAMAKAGLIPVAMVDGRFDVESGAQTAAQLPLDQVDAIVCANDSMAIGALGHITAMGKRVPSDIAMVGFDDLKMASWPSVALTTLRNPIPELGEAVVALLDRRRAAPDKGSKTILLEPELILRKTH